MNNIIKSLVLEVLNQTCSQCGILRDDLNEERICRECEVRGTETKLELLPASLSPTQSWNGKTVRSHPASVNGRPSQKGFKAT